MKLKQTCLQSFTTRKLNLHCKSCLTSIKKIFIVQVRKDLYKGPLEARNSTKKKKLSVKCTGIAKIPCVPKLQICPECEAQIF